MGNERLTITVPQVLKVHPSQVEGDPSGVIQYEISPEAERSYLRKEDQEALAKGARVFVIDGRTPRLYIYPEPRSPKTHGK